MEGGLHKESINKIITVDGIRFTFVRQKTPANCGPLSIVNSLKFLESLYNIKIPEGFSSSGVLRKKIVEITGNNEYESDNRLTDNFLLMRLFNSLPFLKDDTENYFSDINIFQTSNHFFSIVKNTNGNLILLDSLREPNIIGNVKNINSLKEGYKFFREKFGEPGARMSYKFIGQPNIKIIKKESPIIKITKKD